MLIYSHRIGEVSFCTYIKQPLPFYTTVKSYKMVESLSLDVVLWRLSHPKAAQNQVEWI